MAPEAQRRHSQNLVDMNDKIAAPCRPAWSWSNLRIPAPPAYVAETLHQSGQQSLHFKASGVPCQIADPWLIRLSTVPTTSATFIALVYTGGVRMALIRSDAPVIAPPTSGSGGGRSIGPARLPRPPKHCATGRCGRYHHPGNRAQRRTCRGFQRRFR